MQAGCRTIDLHSLHALGDVSFRAQIDPECLVAHCMKTHEAVAFPDGCRAHRDQAGYHSKSRQDVEIDTPDLVPPWKLPEPVPLRTRGPLIQMEAVSFAYPGASKDILRGVTLCIEQVTFSAVKSIRNAFVAAVQRRDTLQMLTPKDVVAKPAY